MSEPLGTLLVRARRLKPEQLTAALQRQSARGGRLGTNLVELGLTDLEALSAALSAQRQIPTATLVEFESTSPAVLSLLPKDLAEHYVAFPLRMGQGAIVLAMATPWDAAAVRVLGEQLRRSVVAKIAPELRIWEFLEKCYRLPRPHRAPVPAPVAAAQPEGPFGKLGSGEYLSSDEEDPFMRSGGTLPSEPVAARTPLPFTVPQPAHTPPPFARPQPPKPGAFPIPVLARVPTGNPSAPPGRIPTAPPGRIPTAPPVLAPVAVAARVPTAPPAAPPAVAAQAIPAGVSLDPFAGLTGPLGAPPAAAPAAAPSAPRPSATAPAPAAVLAAPPPPIPEPVVPAGVSLDPFAGLPAAMPAAPAAAPAAVVAPPADDEPEVLQGEVLPDIEGTIISDEPAEAPAASSNEDDLLEPAPPAAPAEPARTGPFVVEIKDSADPLAAGSWDMKLTALSEILPAPPKPADVAVAAAPAPAPVPAAAPPAPSAAPPATLAPAPAADPLLSWPEPEPARGPALADLAAIEAELASDASPEKIVQGLLKACEGRFCAAVFFVFDGPSARAREGFTSSGPLKFSDGFAIPLDGPSLVHAASERQAPVIEPAGAGADAAVCARLSVAPGSPCAAVPFALRGTVFAVLWGCRAGLPARPELAGELARVAALGAQAFTRLSQRMAPAS